jgi:hypothetical protein
MIDTAFHDVPARSEPTVPLPAVGAALLVRGLAVVALAGVALVHLVQLPDTFRQMPGLGALFTALVVAAAVIAAGLVHVDHRLLWWLAGLTAFGAAAGYALTRAVALPFDDGDVGNWLEPLGLVALFIEASLLGLCAYRLLGRQQRETAPTAST